MDYKEGIPSQKLLNNLYSAIEITKAALSDFANLIEENAEDQQAVTCFDEFIRLSTEYVTAIDSLGSCFVANLNWLPPFSLTAVQDTSENKSSHILPSPHVELQYADGNTPWSFWLSYKPSPEAELLQSALQEEWKQGTLRKFSDLPPIGTYVICIDRVVIFRGIVLSTNSDKVKVRNIDSTCVKVLKLDNIYYMKQKLNNVHAQTVQCCLTKDNSLQNLWNADLSELFKNTLKESNLKVSFVEECADCLPAKFLVNLRACGGTPVDLSHWICSKVLPELIKYQDRPEELTVENLSEDIIDPYYREDVNDSIKDNRVHFNDKSLVKVANLELTSSGGGWSSQLIMPPNSLVPPSYLNPSLASVYSGSPHLGHVATPPGAIAAQYTTTTVFGSRLDGSANAFPVPQQMTTTSSFIVKPTNISNTTLNANTPVFEPRKQSEIFITEPKKVPSIKPNITSSLLKETAKKTSDVSTVKETKTPVTESNEICPTYSKNGFCLSSSCTKKHIKESSLKSSEKPKNVTEASTKNTASEVNSTKTPNLTAGGSTNDEETLYEEDDEDLEEPCINGGYMPTDETRLCRFPIKANGRCWKSQCTKEHEETTNYKWTTDKYDTVTSTFNFLDLPEVDETIELVVTTVFNPFTFYARLPDIYSDIGEGVQHIETFLSLHKSLNDPRNIKSYMPMPGVEPGDGEMYLVQATDNFWKRAMVLEQLSKKSVKVFYIDYGYEETVPEAALRLMEDRFNHLPAQAVRCTLSNLHCSLGDVELRKRGKMFLEEAIKEKVITGRVVSRNVEDSSLELLVTYKEWNINNVMLQKGFCDLIRK